MRFKATEAQLKTIMANAFNASAPVGLGMMQYQPAAKSPDDFRVEARPMGSMSVAMDYVEGRMVKLCLRDVGEGVFDTGPGEPRGDYQSWASTYPTNKALIESAGCEAVE